MTTDLRRQIEALAQDWNDAAYDYDERALLGDVGAAHAAARTLRSCALRVLGLLAALPDAEQAGA